MLLGVGSGRNLQPLLDAGCSLDVVEEDAERALRVKRRFDGDERVRIAHAPYAGSYALVEPCAGALTTHALLHGSPVSVEAAVGAVAEALAPEAPFYATLGSPEDARRPKGRIVDARTWVPVEGPEAGVSHVAFERAEIDTLFGEFAIETVESVGAAETVGQWAHDAEGAIDIVHWFVRARRIARRRSRGDQ